MQTLLETIKETNAAIALKFKDVSKDDREKFFRSESQVKELFMPFFNKQNEVSDVWEFVRLCRLDLQYGFTGIGGASADGSITINI